MSTLMRLVIHFLDMARPRKMSVNSKLKNQPLTKKFWNWLITLWLTDYLIYPNPKVIWMLIERIWLHLCFRILWCYSKLTLKCMNAIHVIWGTEMNWENKMLNPILDFVSLKLFSKLVILGCILIMQSLNKNGLYFLVGRVNHFLFNSLCSILAIIF